MSKILVTGGAGYIGSHTCVELLNAGRELVVIDNLSNSKYEAIRRVEKICNRSIRFYHADLRDKEVLSRLFSENEVDAVIHFAGLKAVGESVSNPLAYYSANVASTIALLEAMTRAGTTDIVFSSSATVYGIPQNVPITEDSPLSTTNPYGRSKHIIEDMLRDLHMADSNWRIAILRYFNPVGAHRSGLIGENPKGVPNNLMPLVAQVAIGKRDELLIYGDDYPTRDGTGVRDYVHVVDLALGHVAALNALCDRGGIVTVNLGTGIGYSVREVVDAFSNASKRSIGCRVVSRRVGDVGECFADTTLARETLGWRATRTLPEMCADAWHWQCNNPDGYTSHGD